MTVTRSPPPQIIRQSLCSDARDPPRPVLEAAMVGVHVLNVEDVVDDTLAGRDIDGAMRDLGMFGIGTGDAAPSEQRIVSPGRVNGSSTSATLRKLTEGRTPSVVAPARSRTTSNGTCSQ